MVALDVYGLRARIDGDWQEVVDDLGRDFAWFTRPSVDGGPAVEVAVERRPPDFDRFDGLRASFVTPRNVVYQAGGTTVVDYFGRALSIFDREQGRVTIQGEDEHLVHEAGYLFLLSRIGEHLDARGFVRLHALGLSGGQGAVAVTLPSGGGKSTLCLQALRDPDARLLSEDSPLLDRSGALHPFPLRVGINATDADLLRAEHVRVMERMEFHPKLALDVEAFADRVEPEPQPLRHLVLGVRTLGRTARLDPLPRRSAWGPLLREGVVGLGIYQGMEFVLQHGMRDVVGKLGVAAGRARVAGRSLGRVRVWQLQLGRDHARNWAELRRLL